MINSLQEGPIIHARDLATTAWLRTGLGASETIPRGHLIATCDRVLQVRPEVRHALATQLGQVTPDRLEQLNLLMQDSRSVRKLADETLNNESIVTAANAEHLLEVMREATAEEMREKHEAQLASERKAARASLRQANSEVSRLTEAVAELQPQQAQAVALVESQLDRVVFSINREAKYIEGIVATVLIALGVAGGYNMWTGTLEGHKIWNTVLVLAGVAGFARSFFGLLERPMPALASMLNLFCRLRAQKQLRALELPSAMDRLTYKGGRIFLAPNPMMISTETTK